MGFYFSRPLASISIWGGKMLAALLLAIGAGLLIIMPVTLLGSGLVDLIVGTSFAGPLLLLGFVIELPFFGLGGPRLHRVFGGLRDACGHGSSGPVIDAVWRRVVQTAGIV